MSKHTPGPWRACEWTGHAATTVKAGDVVVAECSGHGRDSSESIVDARLIAAAPELVEAAKNVLESESRGHCKLSFRSRDLLAAALKKAGFQ